MSGSGLAVLPDFRLEHSLTVALVVDHRSQFQWRPLPDFIHLDATRAIGNSAVFVVRHALQPGPDAGVTLPILPVVIVFLSLRDGELTRNRVATVRTTRLLRSVGAVADAHLQRVARATRDESAH